MSGERGKSSAPGKVPDKSDKSLLDAFLHLFKALRYSCQGLAAGFRLSLSFRQEVLVLAVLVVLLLLFSKSGGAWIAVLGGWGAVMILELVNTALEEALDLITTDFSPQVRDAKDMASAAVFLGVLINAGLWLVTFGPDLLALTGLY